MGAAAQDGSGGDGAGRDDGRGHLPRRTGEKSGREAAEPPRGRNFPARAGIPAAAPAPPPPPPPRRPSRPRAGGRRGWAERRAPPRPHRRRPPQGAPRERCPLAMPHPSRRGAVARQRPPPSPFAAGPAGPAEPLPVPPPPPLRAVRGCRGCRPDSAPLLGDGSGDTGKLRHDGRGRRLPPPRPRHLRTCARPRRPRPRRPRPAPPGLASPRHVVAPPHATPRSLTFFSPSPPTLPSDERVAVGEVQPLVPSFPPRRSPFPGLSSPQLPEVPSPLTAVSPSWGSAGLPCCYGTWEDPLSPFHQ